MSTDEKLFIAAAADLVIKWHNDDVARFSEDTNVGGMILGNREAAILRMVVARKVAERMVRQMYAVSPEFREYEVEADDFVTDLLRINNVK